VTLQAGCPPLRLLEGQDAPDIFGVVDQRDARELGEGLPEELEALPVLRANERDPGDVGPGARVACDEPRLVGEGDVRKHDRDRGRRLLGRAGSLRAGSAEDVDRETNQLSRELGKALAAPIGPADLEGDVFAFDVAALPQSSPKGLQVREAVGGGGG
jgi:hypothetical protein